MTTPDNQILNVTVGEPLRVTGARAAAAMRAVARGEKVKPHFGVNFEQIGQMLATFTPKRWELIAAQARVEIWRTEQANNRAQDRAAQ